MASDLLFDILVVLLGLWSSYWGTFSLMSLPSGAFLPVGYVSPLCGGLSVGFLITCLSFSLPVEGFFLMRLLSGASLSVRFLMSCLV